MSSWPTRMAKRILKTHGFTRERIYKDGEAKWRPGRILDKDGEPFASTWAQASAKMSKGRE